jgi:hypothetical protein
MYFLNHNSSTILKIERSANGFGTSLEIEVKQAEGWASCVPEAH